MAQRDYPIIVNGNDEKAMQLSEVNFIYLKSIVGPEGITVTVDNQPVFMVPGDKAIFGKLVTKAVLRNKSEIQANCVFVVGTGNFVRNELFAGSAGAIGVAETLKTLEGASISDTRSEKSLQLVVDEVGDFTEDGNTLIFDSALASGWTDAIVGPFSNRGLSISPSLSTTQRTGRIIDKNGFVSPDSKSFVLFGGQTQLFSRPFHGFISPVTGRTILQSKNNSDDSMRFHQINELQGDALIYAGQIGPEAGVEFGNAQPDFYRNRLYIAVARNPLAAFREYQINPNVPANLLAGSEAWNLTLIREIEMDFSGVSENNNSLHRLVDGRYLHFGQTFIHVYDENVDYIDDYDNLTTGNNGFSQAASAFFIDEKNNRVYYGAANSRYRAFTLFDISGNVKMHATAPGDMQENFEQQKTSQIVGGVNVIKDGGRRFAVGSVLNAIVQLSVGAYNIPSNYLDYIFEFTYHDGVSYRTTSTGRDSFAVAGISDSFKVSLDHPVTIKTRAGLIDGAPSPFMNDA